MKGDDKMNNIRMNRQTIISLILCILMLTAYSCTAQKEFKMGQEEESMNNWDAAVVHYSTALEKDPGNLTFRIYLLKAKEKAAMQHYEKGMEFKKNRQLELAITEFQIANVLSPSNQKISVELQRVKNTKTAFKHLSLAKDFLIRNDLQSAVNSIRKATELDNESQEIIETYELIKSEVEKVKEMRDIEEAGRARLNIDSIMPVDLVLYDTPLKKVFETLAKAARINIFFDEDFDRTFSSKKVDVEFRDMPFNKVINLLLVSNTLFMNVIDDRSIIIIPDNPRKRKQYTEQVIRVFYLSNAEARKMKALLQAILGRGRYIENEELNTIIVRDEPEKVMLAQRIIELNDKSEPEILLDIELLEVNRGSGTELGMRFSKAEITQSIKGAAAGAEGGGISLQALQFLNQTDNIFSLPSIYYNFLKSSSSAKTLANPQIRITSQQKANLEIGQDVPIKKTLFNTSGGSTYTTESYEFKRIGIKIDVTPFIHFDQSVSLELEITIDNIEAYNEDGYPTVGVRKVKTLLRLQDGETDILAGLIREVENSSQTKVPVLGDIPFLGNIFTYTKKDISRTDLIIALTPHIIRLPDLQPEDSNPIFSGTEDNYQYGTRTPQWYDNVPEAELEQKGAQDSLPVPGTAVPEDIPESRPPLKEIPGIPSAPAEVFIFPAVRRAGLNNIFTVEVRIKNASNVGSVPFYINYDPKIIQAVEAVEGGFLKQGGASTSFMFFPDDTLNGSAIMGYSRLGQDSGADGSGVLAILKFKALGIGETSISFSNNFVKDPSSKDLPAIFTTGKIVVQ